MITDIYLAHPEDPAYNEESIVDQEELSILLAQIKMVLLTPRKTVLGFTQFGVDEDRVLFDFSDTIDLVSIQNIVRAELSDNCTLLKNRDWNVEAYLVPDGIDQHRDAIHLMLTIDKKVRFVIAYQ